MALILNEFWPNELVLLNWISKRGLTLKTFIINKWISSQSISYQDDLTTFMWNDKMWNRAVHEWFCYDALLNNLVEIMSDAKFESNYSKTRFQIFGLGNARRSIFATLFLCLAFICTWSLSQTFWLDEVSDVLLKMFFLNPEFCFFRLK